MRCIMKHDDEILMKDIYDPIRKIPWQQIYEIKKIVSTKGGVWAHCKNKNDGSLLTFWVPEDGTTPRVGDTFVIEYHWIIHE